MENLYFNLNSTDGCTKELYLTKSKNIFTTRFPKELLLRLIKLSTKIEDLKNGPKKWSESSKRWILLTVKESSMFSERWWNFGSSVVTLNYWTPNQILLSTKTTQNILSTFAKWAMTFTHLRGIIWFRSNGKEIYLIVSSVNLTKLKDKNAKKQFTIGLWQGNL